MAALRRALTRPAVLLSVLLVALVAVQSPGRTAFDTKLDLTVDPGGFLARVLQLWNPDMAFGALENQAYGYLFPQGPFFLAGHAAGVPDWVTQAAWAALLLVAGFVGALRLARALGVGTEATRLVAALAYALSPRMLTVLGPISAEALSLTLLPWSLLPLVAAHAGRLPARRAAMLSGLAVLAMGGVNATVVAAVLPLPALYLLTRRPPLRRRLSLWWAAAVGLACLWWAVPLVLLGRYSVPFLDYVESAADTTGPVSVLQALRGTDDWIATVVERQGPFWPAAWTLLDDPAVMVATGLVAVAGLAGLARRDMPERRFLAYGAVLGVVLLALGHRGALASPVAGGIRELLDGVLAPLRNVHKVDPVARLPLALGLAHLLASVRVPGRRAAAVAVAGVLVALTASPLALQQLRPGPRWTALPQWWPAAADWLGQHSGADRTLLVPGSGFGRYGWGRTVDEPLQSLAGAPWATRSQVPIAAEGAVRLMDSVDSVLASGTGSPALADLLARSGVRYLLVRNDLDRVAAGTPRPAVVHQALARSPGLRRVATFGPPVGGSFRTPLTVTGFDLDSGYPALEVYEVSWPVDPVTAVPVADTAVVSGGPESLLPLMESGLLDPGTPTVLAGEPGGPPAGTGAELATDGLRRVERAPGRLYGGTGPVLAPGDPLRLDRPARDVLPFPADGHETAARYAGIAGVTASTSAADPDAPEPGRPEFDAWSAVDGDPGTLWRSGGYGGPVGQWLQVGLLPGTVVDRVDLTLAQSALIGPRVTRVALTTERGRVEHQLTSGEERQVLVTAAGETRWLRVEILGVEGDPRSGYAGIRELTVPGVTPSRTLAVPADLTRAPAGYALRAATGRPACVQVDLQTRCDPTLATGPEEGGVLDRTLTQPAPADYTLTGTVRTRATGAVQPLLDPLFGGLRATGSSILGGDAAVAGRAAVDGDPNTAWVADLLDFDPTLSLRWTGKRSLAELSVATADHPAASRPLELRLVSPAGERVVEVPPSGVVRFPPLVTDRVAVHVTRTLAVRSTDPASGVVTQLPAGIAELRFPALAALTYRPPGSGPTGAPCGDGPAVEVDGRTVPTRVDGTIADLQQNRPLRLTPCGPATVRLAAGPHRVRVEPGSVFVPESLTLTRSGPAPAATPRGTAVVRWGATARTVDVAAGPASLLVVRESANAGWEATLDGVRLPATRVDGWQQAWVVPAGPGGRVELRFTPQPTYRAGLTAGGVAALVLLALAAVRGRPPRQGPAGAPSRWAPAAGRLRVRVPPGVARWGPAGLAAALVALLGGLPGLVALAVAALLARRRPALLPLLVLAAGVAAVAVAVTGRLAGHGQAWALGAPAQALCLLALAGLVATLRPDPATPGPAPAATPDGAPVDPPPAAEPDGRAVSRAPVPAGATRAGNPTADDAGGAAEPVPAGVSRAGPPTAGPPTAGGP